MQMKRKKFDSEIHQRIKKLYVYDNWHAIVALSLDYFLIILAICLSEFSYWFLPLSLLIIGSRQRALATILHEASHYALCKHRKLGRILGSYFSGYLIFQSWDSYSTSHVKKHHNALGTDSDPDLQYYKKSGIYDIYTKNQFYWKFLWSKLLCLGALESLHYLIKNRLLENSRRSEILKIIFVQIVLFSIGTYFIGFKFYFLYWLLPYITTFQFITWFIELSEHYPMINKATLDIASSRNRFSHPIEHFFTAMHGENFHLIHHLFPAIPFWKLKEAHKILLSDQDYAQINSNFGGIFISNNKNKPMWTHLWEERENA